jgi:hypothetical protein
LQLERWSGTTCKKPRQQKGKNSKQQAPYQYSLQLLVPPGQLELGRRLITAMYSSSPDLSDLESPQLMQLVELAECYGVGKVVTAAATQLHKLSVETMPLTTAAAVFELPEACLGLEAFIGVQKTAADVLQQQLGDLEVVWGDKDKQQALLALPLGALLALLRDDRTRMAREDTAVYTAERWLQQHRGAVSLQQQQQMMGVLRLPHCTPTYLADAVAPAASWLRRAGLTEKEALGLCALPGLGSSERQSCLKRRYKDRTTWQLLARPASSVKEVEVKWQLPLCKVEEAVTSKTMTSVRPEEAEQTWAGRRWGIGTDLDVTRLRVYLKSFNAGAGLHAKYTVISTQGASVSRSSLGVYVPSGTSGWGFPTLLNWGADQDWPQVKEWLEGKKLVHPDGCLHLSITVSNVS